MCSMKWSADDEKASLQEAQKALESVLADVKKIDGVKDVQRVVCGGCLDFKVQSHHGLGFEAAASLPAADMSWFETLRLPPPSAGDHLARRRRLRRLGGGRLRPRGGLPREGALCASLCRMCASRSACEMHACG